MKFGAFLQFLIIVLFFINTKTQKLDLETYYTDKFPLAYNNYFDLLNVQVSCPGRGVLKNFILRKDDSNHFWYEYQCYSSLREEVDYGEPIIKGLTLISNHTLTYNSRIYGTLKYLNGIAVDCWVDYGLNSFKIFVNNGLKSNTICKGTKPSFTTPMNVATATNTCNANSIECLIDVRVGVTDEENDTVVGYPLRGFKYVVEKDYYSNSVRAYYLFSYSKLRNMKIVRDTYQQKFEQLRNSNTQQN